MKLNKWLRIIAPLRERLGKLASVYWASRAPHVERHLQLRPGDRVLDLGSNTGQWSRHLAAAGARVIGADIDRAALRQALRQREPALHQPRYLLANAELLPFAAGAFDAIICIDVLDGVPDNSGALREMFRVLKPGGKLILTGISRTRRSYFMPLSYDGYGERHSPAEMRTLLKQAGFRAGAEFSFYQKFGLFSRAVGQWAHQAGIGRIPFVNLAIGLVLASIARLDRLVPRLADDTGIGFVGVKNDG